MDEQSYIGRMVALKADQIANSGRPLRAGELGKVVGELKQVGTITIEFSLANAPAPDYVEVHRSQVHWK